MKPACLPVGRQGRGKIWMHIYMIKFGCVSTNY